MDQGDRGNSIAVDAAGNMVVTGRTDSNDFPVTAGAFFEDFRGGEFDAFVAKLNPMASGCRFARLLDLPRRFAERRGVCCRS